MPQFAANLAYLFTERPLIERFAAAANAGFKAVELQFPYDQDPAKVKAEIDRSGLTMLGLNTAAGGENDFGLAAMPGRERDFAVLFHQALDYIVAIGGRAIHCLAGRLPSEQHGQATQTFIANLRTAADLAAARNITLLIEPINRRDRPNYFLSYVEQAASIIDEVARPNVKMQFDCYHVQIMQGDLIKRIERFLPMIGHVQIAGVPARYEPDEGEVNYPAIYAALDGVGYQGWIAAEYRPRGRTEDGLGWAKAYGVVPR
ncbi:MAG TPA: TIM barrel protein [Xanthobacteraceae bacterium]|nr:TIM barrel protein [Xanthobacteraceae bacterium]